MSDHEAFTVQVRLEAKVKVLALKGTLDLNAAPKLKEELEKDTDKDKPQIVVDFTGVPYISSVGWGCFLAVIQRIRDRGGDIRFAAMNDRVTRIFNVLELGRLFQSFPSVAEGLKGF